MPNPIENGKCDCRNMLWPHASSLHPGTFMSCGTCKRVLNGPAGAQGNPPGHGTIRYKQQGTTTWKVVDPMPTPPVAPVAAPVAVASGNKALGQMLSALEKAGVIKESSVGFYGEAPSSGSPIVERKPCPDCLKTPGRYEGFRDAGTCETCDGSAFVCTPI